MLRHVKQDLGLRIAHEVPKLEPNNPYLLVHLSKLYREAEQAEQSVQLFRRARKEVENYRNKRSYFYEWGTAEGVTGNHCVGAWLGGVSLADSTKMRPPNTRDAVFSLNGLTVAFRELFDERGDPVFIRACGAAAQLALKLPPVEGVSFHQVRTGLARSKEEGVPDVDIASAISELRAGIAIAWQHREDELPEWVSRGDELAFQGLISLLAHTIK